MIKVAVFLALVACASAQVTSTPIDGGKTNYAIVWASDNSVYPEQEFTVGDTVTFTWQGFHDVARTPFTPGSEPCAAVETPAAEILRERASGGTYTYTFKDTDTAAVAFICTVGLHCTQGGQKIIFKPAGATSAAPPPARSGSPAPIVTVNLSPLQNLIPPIAPINIPGGSITIPGVANITVGGGGNSGNSSTGGNSAAGMAGTASAVMAAGLLLAAALVA